MIQLSKRVLFSFIATGFLAGSTSFTYQSLAQNGAGGSAVDDAPVAGDDSLSLETWSDQIWKAAHVGDTEALQEFFEMNPVGFDDERLALVRDSLVAYRENRETATEERLAAREEALVELQEKIDSGDLSQALRAAVKYQTLGDTLEEALDTDEVMEVVRLAKAEIPKAKEEGDWLYAQELLFRLRTLYDDTDERGLYNLYDHQLKEINRRVGMLQQYAPKHLYELRANLAERYGEEELPPFDEESSNDWKERVAGDNSNILEAALRATARDHIESMGSEGWRALLDGGLDALDLLATTEDLAETFPGLDSEENVARFTSFVARQKGLLAETPDGSLSRQHLTRILDGVFELNKQTVELPQEVVVREFGDGAMFGLANVKQDEYSDIIWPDQIRRFKQSTEGNFVGIGVMIRYNERRDIVISNPIEGTPAFRAGIRPDDIIVKVDGKPTVGWTLNDAVDNITGKKGTKVTLGIKRGEEKELIPVEITRDRIDLPSVLGWNKTGLDKDGKAEWDWMIDPTNRIGYIRLTGFSQDSYRDVVKAWEEIQDQGATGLILDLRFNPGGLLDQAWDIANLFIDRGEIVSIEGRPGSRREVLPARRNRARIKESGIGVVVLVNKGSASASEIVSGALQAHDAAVIVGTRTWGKGSVQRVFRIPGSNNAQLKLTTQYYRLPPNEAAGEAVGRLVHKRPGSEVWGVDPDVVVDMTPDQITAAIDFRDKADLISNVDGEELEERPNIDDLVLKGIDPQLETALLILQARAIGTYGVEHARLDQ